MFLIYFVCFLVLYIYAYVWSILQRVEKAKKWLVQSSLLTSLSSSRIWRNGSIPLIMLKILLTFNYLLHACVLSWVTLGFSYTMTLLSCDLFPITYIVPNYLSNIRIFHPTDVCDLFPGILNWAELAASLGLSFFLETSRPKLRPPIAPCMGWAGPKLV